MPEFWREIEPEAIDHIIRGKFNLLDNEPSQSHQGEQYTHRFNDQLIEMNDYAGVGRSGLDSRRVPLMKTVTNILPPENV